MEIKINTGQASKTAKKLLAGIGELLSEASTDFSEIFKSQTDQPATLENMLLSALEAEPASKTKLRKLVAEAQNGQRPAPNEFDSALEAALAAGFIIEATKNAKTLLKLSEPGAKRLEELRAPKAPSDGADAAEREGRKMSLDWALKTNQIEVLRSAKRLGSAVMDVAQNGTEKQQLLAAAELEKVRKRIHAILAGTQLD